MVEKLLRIYDRGGGKRWFESTTGSGRIDEPWLLSESLNVDDQLSRGLIQRHGQSGIDESLTKPNRFSGRQSAGR